MDAVGVGLAEGSRYRLTARRPMAGRFRTFTDFLIALALFVAGARLLVWRFAMLDEVGVGGWLLFAVEAVTVTWMLATASLLIGRTGPDRTAPAPDPYATLDVLIPVAGEPLELVAATIRAAKAIDWPSNVVVCNDSWMAGKENWHEIEVLCRELGVHCLTRTTGPKGKAGNLNHALSYLRADAILTIDADHQVVPDVAQQLLGWLRHDDIAFVATPQEFVGSGRDSLNPTEPVFYRAIQPARDRHGLAFSTGNGALYRREALLHVGGFSEWSVVEDLHTSIRLHDAGWKSVFHPRPVTVGLAPATAAEYARQRLRWALDSMRILRHDPPWRRRGLSRRAKFHYSHTLLSHFATMLQAGFLLGPPAWIVGRQALLTDVGWTGQLRYIGPWLAVTAFALLRWAGLRGAVRTIRLSAAFHPAVFLIAAWKSMSSAVGRGTVTAKIGQPRWNGLVFTGLALPVLLLATMVWGVVDPRPGGSDLAMSWAALMFVVAVGPLLRLGYRRLWPGLAQVTVAVLAVSLAAGSVATTRLGWEAPAGLYPSFQVDPTLAEAEVESNEWGEEVVVGPPVASPPPSQVGPSPTDEPALISLASGDGIYMGYTSDALPYDLRDADRWGTRGLEPQIVHWYQQWGSGESRFRGDWLRIVSDAGRVPMVSWEAWAKPEGEFTSAEQELGHMADVAAGDYDAYIDEWAVAAAEFGDPILLRPFHEMNGFWYPWSIGVNGNTSDDYVAGWRHVVDRFRSAGAHNVSFVWSINTLAGFDDGRGVAAFYPGDAYVDWVATSGFNWDDYDPAWSSWVSAEWVFGETYEVLASFDKPVMFAEIGTGSNGGDASAWVADAMDWFTTLPDLGAVVWFDRSYDGGVDFRLSLEQRATLARAVTRTGNPFQPELALVEATAPAVAAETVAAEPAPGDGLGQVAEAAEELGALAEGLRPAGPVPRG